MWKIFFQANMLRITSCVLVHSSSWAHNKRQMSIKGQWVRCKHNEENMQSKDGGVWTKSKTSWKFLSKVIETWDDMYCKPCVCPKPKYDKMWVWCALNISSKSTIKKVWWCKCFKMKFWSWYICWPIGCSNKKGIRVEGGKGCWSFSSIVGKGKCHHQPKLGIQKG